MPSYKLTYFNVRFRPEVVRLMFHSKDVAFEDCRLEEEDFGKLKASGVLPFGQVPVFEVDGHVMLQSRAIMRFVARELEMYGSSNMEAEEIDEITETVDELVEYARPWWYQEKDPVIKEEKRKEYLEVKGPMFLSFFEKKLEKSTSGFFIGSKLTVADVAVFNIVDILNDTMPEVIAPFPKILALKAKVQAIDGIARYLKDRSKTFF